MNNLLVITGQTATGKTKLALDFARKSSKGGSPSGQNGELLNFDSRQIYKFLDIVTGKDLEEIKEYKIPVHLLDLVSPDEPFSSFDFVKRAQQVIEDVWSRKKTPILVGGTYLYLKHLLYGQDIEIPPNEKLRKKLEKKSVTELQETLLHYYIKMKSKPEINNSDWNNPRRLIRKIEILRNSNKLVEPGKTKPGNPGGCLGSIQVLKEAGMDVRVKIVGLKHKSKESLISAITARVEKRLEQGAIDEVKRILDMGYKKTDPGLQTIGYKQLIAHLEGDMTLEQAKQEWINKEVQYAKRQLTFMKLDTNIVWQVV